MAATLANTDADVNGKYVVTRDAAETITGLKTFSRSTSAPFAVNGGAAKVTNLDADKLDGIEGADYARLSVANAFAGVQTAVAQPRCVLRENAVQSLPDNTETLLTFGTETIDVGGLHAASPNPGRITIVAAGLYRLHAVVRFAPNAIGTRYAFLYKNGSGVAGPATYKECEGHATIARFIELEALLELAAADYIEVYAFQDSGGALDAGFASTDISQQNVFDAVKLW